MASLRRLDRDEQGAEGLEKLLIIGAIVLPLLALLIVFRDDIAEWLKSSWSDVRDDSQFDPNL
jgi:Flp pilus assembly pilin Flp